MWKPLTQLEIALPLVVLMVCGALLGWIARTAWDLAHAPCSVARLAKLLLLSVGLLTLTACASFRPDCHIVHVPFTYTDGTVRDMVLTVCDAHYR